MPRFLQGYDQTFLRGENKFVRMTYTSQSLSVVRLEKETSFRGLPRAR